MAPPFTEAWLTVTVPIVQDTTIYTSNGDFIAVGFVLSAISLLLIGGVLCIIKKTAMRRKK